MKNISECQWKVSMLYFLKKFIGKLDTGEEGDTRYQRAANAYLENVRGLKDKMCSPSAIPLLEQYLKLN